MEKSRLTGLDEKSNIFYNIIILHKAKTFWYESVLTARENVLVSL